MPPLNLTLEATHFYKGILKIFFLYFSIFVSDKKFNFRPVSNLEVEKYLSLRCIKRNKSTGIDNLLPCLLKDAARNISAPLTHLINLSLQTGLFPKAWKLAKIVPTYQSGSHSSFDNYKPISVLPVLSKIIEKAAHQQVMEYFEENKLLSAFQFGFRPKLSTELAATLLLDDIRKNVDEGKLVGAAFIDLWKAFDRILTNCPNMELVMMSSIGLQITFSTDQ